MNFRIIRAEDAVLYYSLRLEGLRADAHAFGQSAEEFEKKSPQDLGNLIEEQLEENGSFVLGAFDGLRLVGLMGLRRNPGLNLRHSANLWGTYVTAAVRGQDVGGQLIRLVIERARQLPGLEHIRLGVGTNNSSALGLYLRSGFEIYGTDRKALKVSGEYIDEYLMVLEL